jgi:hypothetical protein
MKLIIIVPVLLFLFALNSFGQRSALNIPGIHQLVAYSKSENNLQNDARDRQAVVNVNETANNTLLAKLKNTYRTLQQRYNTLGTALSAANIGIQATPMVNRIISNQEQLYQLANKNPSIIPLAYQTELEFVEKAHGLVYYLIGLSASIGDVNQMKLSDRKVLFDFILSELSSIEDLSGNLVNSFAYSSRASLIRSLNPFQDYIDQDKAIVGEILNNAKYLRQ